MSEKFATPMSKYEKSIQKIEAVMREEGVSIIDDQITFDDGKIFSAVDSELRSGFSPDLVALPREDDSCRLILHEYL